MTILVADDDAVHLHLVNTRLRAKGYDVVIARDAMQVLMVAMRSKPAAILLDVNMPGGTGLQALKQLKSSMMTNPIPIIVITANDDPKLPETMMKLGAEDFLRKPFNFDDLLRILARVTGQELGPAVPGTVPAKPLAKFGVV
jgi:CheY-like chemotaxis protein